MTVPAPSLAALIGSRICHDLVSPIGAISNGLELIELSTGLPATPEYEMLRESCDNANARLRYFRIAFGQSAAGQSIAQREVTEILSVLARGTRYHTNWTGPEQMPRVMAQMGLLAAMCLETALPRGGGVSVALDGTGDTCRLTAVGTGSDLRVASEHWAGLTGPNNAGAVATPASSHVQFLMLQTVAQQVSHKISVTQSDTALTLTIAPTL